MNIQFLVCNCDDTKIAVYHFVNVVKLSCSIRSDKYSDDVTGPSVQKAMRALQVQTNLNYVGLLNKSSSPASTNNISPCRTTHIQHDEHKAKYQKT
jgi:hypothetical protein